MMPEARRGSGYGGCLIVLLFLGVVYLCLAPVFFEARESTWWSRRFDDGRRLAWAVRGYVAGHQGVLPGAAWSDSLERSDPGLEKALWREEDGKRLGYAAIPGTLGRKLNDLAPETILFVETRSGRLNDVARQLSELGGRKREGTAIAITAGDVAQEHPALSMRPLLEIGMQLERQHAPGLK